MRLIDGQGPGWLRIKASDRIGRKGKNMTRTVAVLLGAGFVVIVIGIVALIRIINGNGDPPRSVKIIAPNGTQVFVRLPDDSEKHLGDLAEAPLTVDVQVDATIILRYKEKEKVFPSEEW